MSCYYPMAGSDLEGTNRFAHSSPTQSHLKLPTEHLTSFMLGLYFNHDGSGAPFVVKFIFSGVYTILLGYATPFFPIADSIQSAYLPTKTL